MPTTPARLPVTVVTGFLGSGKTTLLRHLLLQSGHRLAVLVNEFGEVGIDGELLRSCGFCPEEELAGRVVELANGCLCCTVQEDFLPTMLQLLEISDRLDGLLIETSGLALPEPLLQALQWPQIRSRIRLNGVVTLVDGEALAAGAVVADAAALEAQRLADPSLSHDDSFDDLFEDQLAVADLVLVSRAASLSPAQLEQVKARLQLCTRPGTGMLPIERGVLPPELVLGLEQLPGSARSDHSDHSDHHHAEQPEHPEHPDHHDHDHVAVQSALIRLEGIFDRSRLERVLSEQIRSQGLIRLKGRVRLPGKVRPLQIQAVGPRLDTWFEAESGQHRSAGAALELVALGLLVDAERLQQALQHSCQSQP